MRIKVLEDRLSDMDPRTGTHHLWHKGDTDEVPDDYGAYLCGLGWVKDLDGNVVTGERKLVNAPLAVEKSAMGSRGRARG